MALDLERILYVFNILIRIHTSEIVFQYTTKLLITEKYIRTIDLQ